MVTVNPRTRPTIAVDVVGPPAAKSVDMTVSAVSIHNDPASSGDGQLDPDRGRHRGPAAGPVDPPRLRDRTPTRSSTRQAYTGAISGRDSRSSTGRTRSSRCPSAPTTAAATPIAGAVENPTTRSGRSPGCRRTVPVRGRPGPSSSTSTCISCRPRRRRRRDPLLHVDRDPEPGRRDRSDLELLPVPRSAASKRRRDRMTLYDQMPFPPPRKGLPWMSDPPLRSTASSSPTPRDHDDAARRRVHERRPLRLRRRLRRADGRVPGRASTTPRTSCTWASSRRLRPSRSTRRLRDGRPAAEPRRSLCRRPPDRHPPGARPAAGALAARSTRTTRGPAPLDPDEQAAGGDQRVPAHAGRGAQVGADRPARPGSSARSSSTQDGTSLFWSVELKIPDHWLDRPAVASTFGLYFNIGQVFLAPYEMVTQYPWPFDPDNPTANFLADPVDGSAAPEDWDPPTYGQGCSCTRATRTRRSACASNGAWSIGTLDAERAWSGVRTSRQGH